VKGVFPLANHKSALKRARQNEIKRIRNRSVKTRVKKVVKNIRLAVKEGSSDTAAEQMNMAKSVIDKAAKKGVIHKKTAARKISRLSKRVKAIIA
jgi:small subunit ribosomal protein S20